MKVVQAVFGVFHHFELAREMELRGHLQRIYSTWPWARLKREGVSRKKVETFPWIHTPMTLLPRIGITSTYLDDQLGVLTALTFDDWMARKIESCDAFIAISGAGLKTGKIVQSRGGKFVCDRGSTHQRYQENVVSEEFRRWKVSRRVSDPRDTNREELIYAEADAITVPSRAAARSFVEMGIEANKVHVIPYGVRLDNFYPETEPPHDSFEVLFAGSVCLRKGIPYLLEAFAALKHPRKKLTIAGSMSPEILPLMPKFNTENVEFLGGVTQTKLRSLMSSSHVMVLPSIEEGLALVQGQALACGCPVICSSATGGEDLFTDGVEGFVVPVRDVMAITDRMQLLADSPLQQAKMRLAGLQRVQALGGWSEYAELWVGLLEKLNRDKHCSNALCK